MIYNYKSVEGFKEKLIDCFIQIDHLFAPSLLSRIKANNEFFSIEEYIAKLNKNGDIFLYILDKKIMGFVAFYSNDKSLDTAYIPLLFVLPEYAGRGIGSDLLHKVKDISLSKKMKLIRVNTWKDNVNALSLYEKNGYKVQNLQDQNVQLILEIAK